MEPGTKSVPVPDIKVRRDMELGLKQRTGLVTLGPDWAADATTDDMQLFVGSGTSIN